MGRHRVGLVGRRAELAALASAGDDRGLIVLRGRSGDGRTAVLARAGAEFSRRGVFVLGVPGAAPGPAWDRFGVHIVLDAIRERFEDLGDRPRLIEAIDALSQLCTEQAYESARGRARLATALGTVFRRLGAIVVLVDDADRIAQPVIGLAAARHAGCRVIAACAEGTDLGERADLEIKLGALSEKDSDSLLRQSAGLPVDDALRQAMRNDLGALYGNPGTIVSTVADLRRRDRLVTVHGHACLRDPEEPIALPPGHRLLVELDACGPAGQDLVRLAGDIPFGVDEIPLLAVATGRSTAECGRAADRLVRAGVLDVDADGRFSVHCPALGAAVSGHPSATRRLHRAIAGHLLGGAEERPYALARHFAAAGSALPREPELAERCRDRAPDTSARWYAAWWHAEDGERRSRAAVELVRRYVRTADYARLARFVAEVPAGELDPADLAAAAALAALCSGRPVAGSVRAAVTAGGPVPAAIEFCDRWFAGAAGRPEEFTVGEVEAAFAPLRRSPVLPTIERGARDIEHALALRDLVPVLASVLGADFGPPIDGPLAAYHEVLTGYADGDWTAALSAARELELDPRADVLARQSARLHAAEMCWWREDKHAMAWLESVPVEDCAFPALRARVDRYLTGAARAGQRVHRGGHGTSCSRSRARTSERLVRRSGNQVELSLAGQVAGGADAEPALWLTEAAEPAQPTGAARRAKRSRQGSGRVVPDQREDLSETESRIIELIRLGWTNRQIALAVRMSEKTVAKHLTRLFAKAGCRTRHGLATSELAGRPQARGA
ncbi:LuxR C-terminal-related transcriptional regulator [Amycolatopsis minnesotensis]